MADKRKEYMSKKNEGKNENPEVSAPAENAQPNETKAPEVNASDPSNDIYWPKGNRRGTGPKVGDSIIYTLGPRSRYAGEERAGTITKIVKAEENLVQFNVHCATPDDFPRNPQMPHWPVAPNSGLYDPSGKPGTWRYLDEEKKAA